MCGGDMELTANQRYGTCDYCGSTMTLPKVDDEQRAAFNRGNHFRRIGKFDKALTVYERIVQDDENDAEAHWYCTLCRFGIEYIKGPASSEYLPACHRASFDSFLGDVNYKAALGTYKDAEARIVDVKYLEVQDLLKQGKYDNTLAELRQLEKELLQKDSESSGDKSNIDDDEILDITLPKSCELLYQYANAIYQQGEYKRAALLFWLIPNYQDAKEQSMALWKQIHIDCHTAATGNWHTVGLKANGTVVAVGNNDYGQCNVNNWSGIKLPAPDKESDGDD